VSLRLRLLLALVGLVAAGLLIADLVTFFSLQSFLVKRVDQQLVAAKVPVARALATLGQGYPGTAPSAPPGEPTLFPPGTYGEVIDSSGAAVVEHAFIYGGTEPSPPSLPADVVTSAAHAEGGQLFLTASDSGHSSERYRVLASPIDASDYTLVTAIPLTDVTQTLGRLVLVEIVVTLSVLLGLGALAWWLVRRELHPLDDMAATAGAIAAGDLTQRVDRADSRTEVGRLGQALNSMLAQIERAFAERQASEQALRRFLAQASHELRTPLASIRGYAELFRRGARERPEDLELAMRRIEQEGARMGALVEELLLLARLDEGRPLEREPVDLKQVAVDAVADAKMVEPERVVRLEPADDVTVVGDEARLRQVVANLVANALQHAGADAHIRVGTTSENGWAVLEVCDDGAGMTDEVAARAFERFYKAGPAGGAGEGGSGLGLSIVSAITTAHGGEVGLQTAPGQGARFRVRLPLAPVPGETRGSRAGAG
jgi:two-component system OmpR family sensor kinase